MQAVSSGRVSLCTADEIQQKLSHFLLWAQPCDTTKAAKMAAYLIYEPLESNSLHNIQIEDCIIADHVLTCTTHGGLSVRLLADSIF